MIYEVGGANTVQTDNVDHGVVHLRMVLPGPSNNYFMTPRYQYVTNGSGDLVVDNFEIIEECR